MKKNRMYAQSEAVIDRKYPVSSEELRQFKEYLKAKGKIKVSIPVWTSFSEGQQMITTVLTVKAMYPDTVMLTRTGVSGDPVKVCMSYIRLLLAHRGLLKSECESYNRYLEEQKQLGEELWEEEEWED